MLPEQPLATPYPPFRSVSSRTGLRGRDAQVLTDIYHAACP